MATTSSGRIAENPGLAPGSAAREQGHRILVVHRKGGKAVTITLGPRTAGVVDLAIGDIRRTLEG